MLCIRKNENFVGFARPEKKSGGAPIGVGNEIAFTPVIQLYDLLDGIFSFLRVNPI
jgi:hypothetical protein